MARGGGFEPPCPCGHRISNPTPYQARRSPHREGLNQSVNKFNRHQIGCNYSQYHGLELVFHLQFLDLLLLA